MGIGASILLIAAGAILTFAVHVTTSGFNLNTVGIILMVVGGIGLLTALLIAGNAFGGGYRRTTVVDDGRYDPRYDAGPGAAPGRRRVVRDTYVD